MGQSTVECRERVVVNAVKEDTIRVLHVDDEDSFLSAAKQILEMQGAFQVDTASSVEEATERMKEKEYDAIVCDYVIPRKDGLQFLKELRDNGSRIPFIIFTGKGREAVAIEALNLGADRYLSKIGGPETVYGELAYGIREVVSRRKAEKALVESEEKWRTLAEQSPNMIFVNKKGKVAYANKRCEEIMGYKKEEFYSPDFDFLTLIHPEHIDMVKATFARHTNGEEVQPYQYALLTKEGKRIEAMITTKLIKYEGENALLGIVTDITERKKIEEALRESEDKLKAILTSSPDAITVFDLNGNVVELNQAAMTMHNFSEKKEIIGKSSFDFVAPREIDRARETFKRTLEQGSVKNSEFTLLTKEGREFLVELSAAVVPDAFGKPSSIVAVIKDITQRKKVAETLQESELKFRLAFENAKDAILWADIETGLITNCNKAAEALLEKDRGEILGHSQSELHPPQKAEYYSDMFRRHIEQKGAVDDEAEVITKSGKTKPVHITASVTLVGEKPIIQGIFRDISERKRAERTLRESQQKFEALFRDNPEAAVYVDPEFHILNINPGFEQLFGYCQDEVKGKRLLEVIVPDGRLEESTMLDEQAKKGHVHQDTVRKRKDNSLVSVSISAAPIMVEDNLIGYVGLYRDISDLEKAQQQLEESNKHFQTLFDLMVDPVAIVDGKGKILAVTDKVEEITGFKKEELVGKNFLRTKIASAKTKAIMMKNLAKRIMGMHMEPYEVEILTKDGRKLPYEINAETIDYRGELADMVVFRDISQRKNLEAKLRVVGTLTRHDARNKLSVVTMNTFLAKKKLADNNEALKHLNEIESAVGEVERIFDFAKTYEMLGMEKLVSMDVGKTFEETVHLFSNLQSVKVVNDCEGLTVQADSLLRQLFYNLIHNSLKHGKKVSQIRVFYEEDGKDQLELVYEDDGVGIARAEKEKIFEERYGNRTGHGLYVIRKICEVYGWRIREMGEHGKCAQFSIAIPKMDRIGK